MGIRAGGGGVTRGRASGGVTGSLLLVEGEERLSDDVVVEDLGTLFKYDGDIDQLDKITTG
jgi:hypothetical protein